MESTVTLAPSYTGKHGIYCSYPDACRSRVEEYIAFLQEHGKQVCFEESVQALKNCDSLLVFLAPNADLTKARRDITYALDHKKHLVYVLLGDTELDSGLKIQLGLAQKIIDSEDAFEQLLSALAVSPTEGEKPCNYILIAALLAVVAAVIVAVFVFGGSKENAEPAPPAEEHIAMENALRDGLIQNGIDTSGDGGISKQELEIAQELDLSSLGITDISPLAAASELVKLDLSGNNISDITPLAGMKKLQSIDLSGNAIDDFQVLTYLPDLTEQDISEQHTK